MIHCKRYCSSHSYIQGDLVAFHLVCVCVYMVYLAETS